MICRGLQDLPRPLPDRTHVAAPALLPRGPHVGLGALAPVPAVPVVPSPVLPRGWPPPFCSSPCSGRCRSAPPALAVPSARGGRPPWEVPVFVNSAGDIFLVLRSPVLVGGSRVRLVSPNDLDVAGVKLRDAQLSLFFQFTATTRWLCDRG